MITSFASEASQSQTVCARRNFVKFLFESWTNSETIENFNLIHEPMASI